MLEIVVKIDPIDTPESLETISDASEVSFEACDAAEGFPEMVGQIKPFSKF